MIFNSVTYLAFLFLFICCYWLIPHRFRPGLILAGSLTFYGFWRIEFIPLIFVSILVDYFVSLKIYRTPLQQNKKKWLKISLFVNLGLLFYFKYLLFFQDNALGLAHYFGAEIDPLFENIILPLGISFYTFQTISYTVDVYRGFIKPEHNFLRYSCYVVFFPQLIAGPILRAKEILPQLAKHHYFKIDNFIQGIKLILYGLFLKVVLADNIAPLVDTGFSLDVEFLSAIDVWTLAFLFGFQIYFDFSAYSQIAKGTAKLLGIHFPDNFNFPYLATSPREFWKRWHITLSSWIRDYLYLPLMNEQVYDKSRGGLETVNTEKKETRPTFSLFVTWGLMGFWHGANWTFFLWGVYHAFVIFAYRKLRNVSIFSFIKNSVILSWLVTISFMMLGWIPFRTESVTDALMMYSHLFSVDRYLWLGLRENTYLVTFLILTLMLMLYLSKLYILPYIQRNLIFRITAETIVLTVVIANVFVFLRPINQFIYFQF